MQYTNTKSLRIGRHTQIELLLRGDEFLGFGKIAIGGVPVRARDVPLRPLVETPEGHQFRRLTLRGIRETAGSTVLHLDALGEPGFYGGSQIDYHYERVPARSVGCRQGKLEIILQPASFAIEGLTYTGFSYQYRLRLRGCQAHQLLDRATWEIGGRAAGNIIVSQSQCCEPEHRCTRDSSFHTWVANKRVTNGRDEYNFLSYCFTPRFSSMQCFDWLDAAAGSLLVFYDRLEHIKGSVFKESGQPVIHHCDLHSFALTDRVAVPAKFVVFHPTRQHADHEFRNRWTACRDFVFRRYQKQYGIREDYPRTEHHSWLDWERDHVFGHHICPKNAKRWYYDLADPVVPAMKRMGFEKYFDGALLKSLYTENPKEHYPNFTMWDYVISEKFGGMAGLKYLVRKCHQHGIKCELWMDCGLNQKSPILKQHPDWVLRDPHLGPYNGALGFIMGLDLNNDEAFAFIKQRYTRFVREAKIDGIFHDSFPNISGIKNKDQLRRPAPPPASSAANRVDPVFSAAWAGVCRRGERPVRVAARGHRPHGRPGDGRGELLVVSRARVRPVPHLPEHPHQRTARRQRHEPGLLPASCESGSAVHRHRASRPRRRQSVWHGQHRQARRRVCADAKGVQRHPPVDGEAHAPAG
jgi:hypothetical protein